VTYKDADVKRLRDPVAWDIRASGGRKSVYVLGSGTAIVVNVALQASLVVRVTDQENTLDGVEVCALAAHSQ
jgi:hypothetical protein